MSGDNDRPEETTEFLDSFFSEMDEVGALPDERLSPAQPAGPGPAAPALRSPGEMLPYGATYTWPDGRSSVLARVVGPTLELTSGEVALGDPASLRGARIVERILPGPQPTEAGVLESGATGDRRRVVVVALGDTASVVSWSPFNEVSGRLAMLRVGSSAGVVYDAGALRAVKAAVAGGLLESVAAGGLVAVEGSGRVLAVAFDCGTGEGPYPALLGYDALGRAVALALDLGLPHGATTAPS